MAEQSSKYYFINGSCGPLVLWLLEGQKSKV